MTYKVVQKHESSALTWFPPPNIGLRDHHSLSLEHIPQIQHVRMPQGFSLITAHPYDVLATM